MRAAPTDARIVVGGVGHLYQGDLDFGRVFVERLGELGDGIAVEEFSYGAVAVAQRLEELHPELLVVVGAAVRGRTPGTLQRRDVSLPARTAGEIQGAIADAVTGYIGLELLLEVAGGLGALPHRTVAIELEPAQTDPAEELSAEAEAALLEADALVRAEVAAATRSGIGRA